MHKPFLSIVIPAYNEEKEIPKTLWEISNFLNQQNYSSEIIVVDDGSTDATAATVNSKRLTVKNLKLLRNPRNFGKGAAVRRGVLAASGDYILFTDADNSTPIEEINKLLPYLTTNHKPQTTNQIVIGSRHLPDSNIKIRQPWYRRLMSHLANRIIQALLVPEISDTQCGFKLFRNKVAKKLFSISKINHWGFDMEILFLARKKNVKIAEVPITWLNRKKSRLRPIKGTFGTIKELLTIKANDWRRMYD